MVWPVILQLKHFVEVGAVLGFFLICPETWLLVVAGKTIVAPSRLFPGV